MFDDSRATTWAVVCSTIALFVPFAWPLLSGRVFWADDFLNFHLPLRHLYQQALLAGDSLLWTPSILSGFYIHGEGQVGMLHPFHLILYRLFPLVPAFNIELLANYAMAFAGMVGMLRRLRFGATEALFGGMLFAFCGFLVLHDMHLNLVATAAHLGWLLWSLDVLMDPPSRRARAIAYTSVALLSASQLLMGFPQAAEFNLLAMSAYALVKTVPTCRYATLAAAAAAMLTGTCIGAIQLVPTLDVASESIRPLLGSQFAGELSLHPANLLQLFSPYLLVYRVYTPTWYPFLHEYGLYSCALFVVAPFWVAIRWRSLGHRRSLVIAATAGGAVALLLAFGRYAGLDALFSAVPGVRWTRGSTRFLFLVEFALSIIAVIAVEDLRVVSRHADPLRIRLRALWIPAAVSVVATVAIASRLVRVFPDVLTAPANVAAVGPLIVIAVTALFAASARGVRAALPALVVATAGDLFYAGIRPDYALPPRTLASLTASLPRVQDPSSGGRLFVGQSATIPSTNLPVVNGFRLTAGYVALRPAAYVDLESPLSLRLSGTEWRWQPEGALEATAGALPRARLLSEARFVPLGKPGDIRGVQLEFIVVDVTRTAVVNRILPPLAGPPGQARLVVDRPGWISVETHAPGPQVLALTERFHDGWTATSNGRPMPTLRIHGDFLGCLVDGGDQLIEFRFRPQSFTNGLVVSAIGVGLLALGVAVLYRV